MEIQISTDFGYSHTSVHTASLVCMKSEISAKHLWQKKKKKVILVIFKYHLGIPADNGSLHFYKSNSYQKIYIKQSGKDSYMFCFIFNDDKHKCWKNKLFQHFRHLIAI